MGATPAADRYRLESARHSKPGWGYRRSREHLGSLPLFGVRVSGRPATRSAPINAIVAAALLFAVSLIAHAGGLDGEFLHWDDDHYITDNEHIRALDLQTLRWSLTSFHANNWHPLTWISHAIDVSLHGLDARGHHLTSLLLHCFNGVWFFALCLLLIARFGPFGNGDEDAPTAGRQTLLAAFLAAVFFAVHPLHVESVAWSAERKDVLFVFFLLPSLIAYVRYAGSERPRTRLTWYALSLFAFGLSILSKPMAVTLPALLLILDIHPLRRTHWLPSSRSRPARGLLLEKLPYFALSGLSIGMTLLAQGQAIVPLAARGLGFRILNAIDALTAYFWRWLLPIDLSPYYPYPSAHRGVLANAVDYSLAILFVLAVTFACKRLWERGIRTPATVWALYLVTLSPVIGIVSVGNQASADRYTYLPALPLDLLAGVGITLFVTGRQHAVWLRALGIKLTVIAVVVLIWFAHTQSRVWANDLRLWQTVSARTPNDLIVQAGLGFAHLRADHNEAAIRHLEAALDYAVSDQPTPLFPELRAHLAELRIESGDLNRAAEILAAIEPAYSRRGMAILHARLATRYCNLGNLDAARKHLRQARNREPLLQHARALGQRVEHGGCRP